MTGARRFSLSSPDWGQAHLSLDAIVAYVDDELEAGPHARAEAHLECCGECRAEVVAQRQARTALRAADCPRLPSSLLNNLRSIPVDTELPPMPPGLGVTAEGQFVLLRDVPSAHGPGCPDAPPAGLGPGPATAPRRFSRRARLGAVSGLALGALAVGALATPAAPEPAPPTGALGGAILNTPALNTPALNTPALNTPASRVSTEPAVGDSASRPDVVPAVIDAQLRDRLDRIPAAFRP